jgi:feruloyl esterase
VAPTGLTASQTYPDGRTRTRPLCSFPALPRYRGSGDPDLATSFACRP